MGFLIKSPRGTRNILTEDSYQWEFVLDLMKKQAKMYGFTQVRTPVFEYTELFTRTSGKESDVVQKEMYTFLDRSGRSITLRPEGTAGVAKAILEQGTLVKDGVPSCLFYILPCYRYEKPQANRLREFTQFGAEIFGSSSPLADAKVILLANSIFKALSLSSNVYLKLNSVGCKKCRKSYIKELKDYLMINLPNICSTCVERLKTNPMRVLDCKNISCKRIAEKAPSTLDFACKDCKEHFSSLQFYLNSLGVRFSVDKTIVRGLDYYTGTVFEFIYKVNSLEKISVCGGGRYDNLVQDLGGTSTPALGFGIGVDRLMLVLNSALKTTLPKRPGPDVYIVCADNSSRDLCLKMTRFLIDYGIFTECDIMERSLSSQLRHADKLNSKFSIVIGRNEWESNFVFLKNMMSGEKTKIFMDEDFGRTIFKIVKEQY